MRNSLLSKSLAGLLLIILMSVTGAAADRVAELVKAAAAENPDAMMELGQRYLTGVGVDQNYAKAADLLRQSADKGNSAAMVLYGQMYFYGLGTPVDYAQAKAWYEKAAAQNNPTAWVALGQMYFRGVGVPVSYAEAKNRYAQVKPGGNWAAMRSVALMYLDVGEGSVPNYGAAMDWLRGADAAGDMGATTLLGRMYEEITNDYVSAIGCYSRAVDRGDSAGMYYLGVMCARGVGMTADLNKAVEYFRNAAQRGNVRAMISMGQLCRKGQGVPRDYAQALNWFHKVVDSPPLLASQPAACADAMTQIGYLYQEGLGVPLDYAQARQWFEMGIALAGIHADTPANLVNRNRRIKDMDNPSVGGGAAMNSLGMLYLNGLGVPRDVQRAFQLFQNGVDANDGIFTQQSWSLLSARHRSG